MQLVSGAICLLHSALDLQKTDKSKKGLTCLTTLLKNAIGRLKWHLIYVHRVLDVQGPGIRWSGNSSGIQDVKDTDNHEPGTTELVSTKKTGEQATADSEKGLL